MSFIFTFKRATSDTALYKEQVKFREIESNYRCTTEIEKLNMIKKKKKGTFIVVQI